MNAPPHDPLTELRQTFPGWYIDHDAILGRWIAMRYRPLTVQEHKAGAKYFLQRACPDRLSAALTEQTELTRRTFSQDDARLLELRRQIGELEIGVGAVDRGRATLAALCEDLTRLYGPDHGATIRVADLLTSLDG